jgi:hypothetical protein
VVQHLASPTFTESLRCNHGWNILFIRLFIARWVFQGLHVFQHGLVQRLITDRLQAGGANGLFRLELLTKLKT